ncbi:unnamed protein product [Amoebophrya sp. A25]|nr:unnamed protein product [Amoebophrya sp. A25]|eukprot:GSA25T00010442001.1
MGRMVKRATGAIGRRPPACTESRRTQVGHPVLRIAIVCAPTLFSTAANGARSTSKTSTASTSKISAAGASKSKTSGYDIVNGEGEDSEESQNAGVPDCRCDCCNVERAAENAALLSKQLDGRPGESDVIEIECDARVITPADVKEAKYFLQKKRISSCRQSKCLPPAGDLILDAGEAALLDLARFCRAECEPAEAKQGGECKRRLNSERSAHQRAFVHFAAKRKAAKEGVSLVSQERKNEQRTAASTQASSAFTKALEGLLEKGKAVAQNAERLEQQTVAAEQRAKKDAALVEAAREKNREAAESSLPALLLEVQNAQVGAGRAVREVRKLSTAVSEAAEEAAADQVTGTLEDVEAQSLREEKKTAEEKAAKTKDEMVGKAAAEGDKASQAYVDAQTRAADRAAEYQKRGDEFAALSNQWQQESTLAVNNANQLSLLGKTYEAERQMAHAKFMMEQAGGLTGTAQNLYEVAERITESLPLYAAQASAANYHAQFMLNPDVPAPRPPII